MVLVTNAVTFRDGVAGPAEVSALNLYELDERGLISRIVAFAPGDLDAARSALDARHAESSGDAGNAAWRAALRTRDAKNRRDWDGYTAAFSPELVYEDRNYPFTKSGDDALATDRILFTLDEFFFARPELIAARGERLVLVTDSVTFRDGVAGPAEASALHLFELDEHGLISRIVAFAPDNLDAATAALDARHAEIGDDGPRPNRAWEVIEAQWAAFHRDDERAWRAFIHPDLVYDERRSGVLDVYVGDEAIASQRVMFDMDQATVETRLVATAGDRLAVEEGTLRGSDGLVGEMEAGWVTVTEIDEDGRIVRVTAFNPGEVDAAMTEMDARADVLDAGNQP